MKSSNILTRVATKILKIINLIKSEYETKWFQVLFFNQIKKNISKSYKPYLIKILNKCIRINTKMWIKKFQHVLSQSVYTKCIEENFKTKQLKSKF